MSTPIQAYEVIFESGAHRTVYGKDREDALKCVSNHDHIDMVIDVAANLDRERKFREVHSELLKDMAIRTGTVEFEIQKELAGVRERMMSGSLARVK